MQTTTGIIEGSIRRSYANSPEYLRGLEAGVYSAVPANAIQVQGSNRRIVSPWGGQITAGAGDRPGTDAARSPNRFWIRVEELPEEACQAFAKSFLNRSDVVGVTVAGSGSLSRINTDAQIEAFDTAPEIDAGCDGGDDDQVGIVFRG